VPAATPRTLFAIRPSTSPIARSATRSATQRVSRCQPAQRQIVREAYDASAWHVVIREAHEAGLSLRAISDATGGRMTHETVRTITRGEWQHAR
jgi:hypothetical protein